MSLAALAIAVGAAALAIWCLKAVNRAVDPLRTCVEDMRELLEQRDQHALKRFAEQLRDHMEARDD